MLHHIPKLEQKRNKEEAMGKWPDSRRIPGCWAAAAWRCRRPRACGAPDGGQRPPASPSPSRCRTPASRPPRRPPYVNRRYPTGFEESKARREDKNRSTQREEGEERDRIARTTEAALRRVWGSEDPGRDRRGSFQAGACLNRGRLLAPRRLNREGSRSFRGLRSPSRAGTLTRAGV